MPVLLLFAGLASFCAVLQLISYLTSNKEDNEIPEESKKQFTFFQLKYLVIYYIVMFADWLQGPYVYALYDYYGFAKEDIALLFIAGFSSSMIFGTFIASVADKYGRKKICILFGIIYSLSCMTKLVNDFKVLLLGRILAGVATSILFSGFEAWMVYEHSKIFPPSAMSSTFSMATFGNGIVAILSGFVASFVASRWGFVAPFITAMGFLVLEIVMVIVLWGENYGDSRIDVLQQFQNATVTLWKRVDVLLLGATTSLFESSMFVFVFMWTPALTEIDDPDAIPASNLPYGLIFACYMVSIMIGSSIFSLFIRLKVKLEMIGACILLFSALSLCVPAFLPTNQLFLLCAFMVFEICCGLYFPCFGTLRARYIPENTRATIMNFFRIPLNGLVVIVLVKVDTLTNTTIFTICVAWLLSASILSFFLTSFKPPTETKPC